MLPQEACITIKLFDDNQNLIPKPILNMQLCNSKVLSLLDSGSSSNIIDLDVFTQLQKSPSNAISFNQQNVRVDMVSGHAQMIGYAKVPLVMSGQTYITEFIVCKKLIYPAILGR